MADGIPAEPVVTLAVLSSKMDRMASDVSQLRAELTRLLADLESRTRANELHCASCVPRLDGFRDDLQALKARATLWDSINSIAAVIAGVVGAFWKSP